MLFLPAAHDILPSYGVYVIILSLTLQNSAMRIITFNSPRVSATPLHSDLGIFKSFDHVKVMNILYVHKFLNGDIQSNSLITLNFKKKSLNWNQGYGFVKLFYYQYYY